MVWNGIRVSKLWHTP